MVKFRKNLIFAYSSIPLFRYSVFRVLLTPLLVSIRCDGSVHEKLKTSINNIYYLHCTCLQDNKV